MTVDKRPTSDDTSRRKSGVVGGVSARTTLPEESSSFKLIVARQVETNALDSPTSDQR